MTHGEDLLTTTQVGALLGKSGRTVLRMVHAGLLEPRGKMPGPVGAYLFAPEDVEDLVQRAVA